MKDKKQNDESEIKIALEFSNNIIATLRESFLVLDKNLRVISVNQAFCITFKVAEKDTIGRLLSNLGDGQWNIPGLLILLKEILPEKTVVRDYEVEHKFDKIGQRFMNLNARQLSVPKKIVKMIYTSAGSVAAAEEEKEELIMLAIEDITERKLLQLVLEGSERRYRGIFDTAQDGLLVVDKAGGNILNANSSTQRLLGYSLEEFLKNKLWEIGLFRDVNDFQDAVLRLEVEGVLHLKEVLLKTKKNSYITVEAFITNKIGTIQCNLRDITVRRKLEGEVEKRLKELEIFYKAALGREERIMELKKEILVLKEKFKQ